MRYGALLLVFFCISMSNIGFIEASENRSGYSTSELERFKRLKEEAEKGNIRPGKGVVYSSKDLQKHEQKVERQARKNKTPRYKDIPQAESKYHGYKSLFDYEPPVPYSWVVGALVLLLNILIIIYSRRN